MAFHRLLSRQLKKLGCDGDTCADWSGFLELVNATYGQADDDREMLERSLQVSSEEVMQTNAELRVMMSALRESEEKYRLIFNTVRVGVLRCTVDGRLLSGNPALAAMFGYPDRRRLLEGITDMARDCVHNPGGETFLELLLASSGGGCIERELTRLDGSTFIASINASLQRDEQGLPAFITGTLEDITERRQAEDALRKSESLLRALKEGIPDLVWLKDPGGVFLSCNPAFEEYFGVKERDILGRTDHDFVDAETAGTFLENDRKALDAGGPVRNEEWLTFAGTGYQGLFETIKTPMRDAAGSLLGVLGIGRDITERRLRELEIQHWMQRFDIVNAAARHVFYDYDLASGRVIWKGGTMEVLGIRLEDFPETIESWKERLHPKDAPALLRHMDECRACCGKYEADYRLRHLDGHYVHVHASGVFRSDETGRATQMLGILQDISERKNAEMALTAREKMYRTLFESAQDAILVLDGQRIVDCNVSTQALFGCGRASLLGRTPADLSPPRQASGEDSASAMPGLLDRAASGDRLRFDWLCSRADGSPVHVEVSLAPMDVDGTRYLLAFLHDVTERKRAERLLRQSEEKFSKVFNLAPYSITISRLADGVLLNVNEAFEPLTGYTFLEVAGREPLQLGIWVDPAQRRLFLEQLRAEGLVVDFEFVMRRKDGSVRSALDSGQCIEVAGEACFINIVRDITEMKLMQQTMVQTEKMMSLGGLAAGMAHEINNPLGIIFQSVLGVLRRLDPETPANRQEAQALNLDLDVVQEFLRRRNILRYLDGIREAGYRATEIVRHMLNFSRSSDSRITESDLRLLVRQAASLAEKGYDLKENYDFKRIALTLALDEDLPPVPCVPSEIEQVLLNLLRNAAQAMAEACTRHPSLTVRVKRAEGQAVIEVEDNGPGIPKAQLGRVFEPFFTTKKVGQGTGLGLSVSYFIITNTHRGVMTAASEPGHGAVFTVRLPLVRRADNAATSPAG
jgi:PAS domain S-box-containing protein